MLRVNLTQELQATKEATPGETDLLAYNETVLLEELGIDTYLMQRRRLEKRKKLMQEAFTEEQVRKLCIKYRLRCLDADLFKGELDEAVPQKRSQFEKDFQEGMQQEVNPAHYRIIAPAEMFRLSKIELDPLLLYRFQEKDTTYYKLIHQWGGDMSKWRSIINYPLRSLTHLMACSLLFWSIIILSFTLSIDGLSMGAASMVIALLVITPAIFTVSFFKNINGDYQTSDRIWNSQDE